MFFCIGDPLPYHCDQCPKKLRQLKSLRIHKRNCPGQSAGPPKPTILPTSENDVEHDSENNSQDRKEDDITSSDSRDRSSDEEVAKTQTHNKTIPCPLCPIRFSFLLAMEGHRGRMHEGILISDSEVRGTWSRHKLKKSYLVQNFPTCPPNFRCYGR